MGQKEKIMQFKTIARRVGIPFVVGTATVAGMAVAAYTPHAAFWADVHVAQAQHPQVSAATATDDLWPGTCTGLTFTVKNPNPLAVKITGLSQHGDFQTGTERQKDFLRFTADPNALNGKTVPAGEERTFTIKDAVCEATNTDDANANHTFKVGVFTAWEVIPGTNPKAQFNG